MKTQREYQAPSITLTFYMLLIVLAFSPLFFGSSSPLYESITFIVTGLALSLWSISSVINYRNVSVKLERISFLVVPFLLLIAWVIFQINSPIWAHSIWNDFISNFSNINISPSISINPDKSIYGLIRIINFAVIFFISLQLCRDKNNAKIMLYVIAIASFIYGLYGIYIQLSGAQQVLWHNKTSYKHDLTSTFINRNTYATYAGIGLIICIALTLEKVKLFFKQQYKHRIFEQFTRKHLMQIAIPLTGVITISIALFMTNSRGGVGAFILALTIFLISVFASKFSKIYKVTLSFLLSASIILVVFLSTMGDGDFSTSSRKDIYSNTIEAFRKNPVTGTGLGSFEDVFRQYRDTDTLLTSTRKIDYAHNVYLEILLELGVIGSIFIIIPFFFIFTVLVEGVIGRKKDIYSIIALSSLSLVTIHSLVDFSVQIAAIYILFAAILGMGCAQSWSSKLHPSIDKKSIYTTFIISSSLIILLLFFGAKYLTSEITDRKSHHDIAISQIQQTQNEPENSADRQILLRKARDNILKHLSIKPASPYAWLHLAHIYGMLIDENNRKEKIRNAIIMSYKTGRYDLNLIPRRTKIAFFDWDNYDYNQQILLNEQICLGWKFNQHQMSSTLTHPTEKQRLCKILDNCQGLHTEQIDCHI